MPIPEVYGCLDEVRFVPNPAGAPEILGRYAVTVETIKALGVLTSVDTRFRI